MKITKSSAQAAQLLNQKQKALLGCNTCPCCGTPYKGIPIIRSWSKGIFKMQSYEVQCFHCQACGAKWESDKYIVE